MRRCVAAPMSRPIRPWRAAALFPILSFCGLAHVRAAGTTVYLPVGGENVRAYLVTPSAPGPTAQKPGIVVMHHFWGLDTHTRSVADRFADEGYVTIAPDLYRGVVGADPGLADDLMRKVDDGRAVAIVKEAIAYLRDMDGSARRPVALVGFDLGGRVSLAAALQGADVQGLVIFYAHVETSPERLSPLKTDVLGIFARDDHTIAADEVKKFEEGVRSIGRTPTIITYPSVGHSFFDDAHPDYDRPLALDAWVRTKDWLTERLNAAQSPKPASPAAGHAPATGAPPHP